ncbi:hypothetical protein ACG7TL_001284 [Trametes sanguinea]
MSEYPEVSSSGVSQRPCGLRGRDTTIRRGLHGPSNPAHPQPAHRLPVTPQLILTMSVTEGANPASSEVTRLNTLLTNSTTEGEDFHALSDTFEEALGRPDVQEQARKDVRERAKNAGEMKETFSLIRMKLIEFDNANFQDKDDKLLKLGAQWREFQHRFHTILDKDRDNASAASTFMQIYSMDILTDVHADDRATLREQLQGFITVKLESYGLDILSLLISSAQELDKKAACAVDTRAESKRLAEDIRVFTANVEETLIIARSRLTADVELDKARLESLHEQMQRSDFHATEAKEMLDLEQEIKQCDAEQGGLVSREQLLAKYQANLPTMQKDILGLATKVDLMVKVEIWDLFKHDVVALDWQLAQLTDPDMPINSRIMRQIKASREAYMFLATLLDMYVKGQ